MRLKGKVAIITGAASGIGRATAQLFVNEGARVVIADVNTEMGQETIELIEENQKGGAIFVQTDVARHDEVKEMARATVQNFGRLDILVNNAADRDPGKPVVECPEEEWDRTVAITLKGPYLCAKHSIPEMAKVGGGTIVNVSSIAGIVTFPNGPAYAASKAGLNQLTKNIALDYRHQNIRVNAICPGVIDTPGTAREKQNEEWRSYTNERILPGRWGTVEEIAYAILFLASDESSYLNGAVIVADGGWVIR
jgi:NAD(P)-dependent dehydrogenase (short-subunit alcohol dehydrogenase family)